MLCVVASRIPESRVKPLWIQEGIVMHPEPSPGKPFDGPFAEIFVTILLRCQPGYELRPDKGECDFAFIHRGRIRGPEDFGASFNGGQYRWINNLTPTSLFGPIKRSLKIERDSVNIVLEPLDLTGIRFGLTSPVQSVPVETELNVDFPGEEEGEALFTYVQARPKCSKCSGTGSCIARIRFTSAEGVEEGQGCVKYPAYGPNYVALELDNFIENLSNETRKINLKKRFREIMFDTGSTLYDLAVLGSETCTKYDIVSGHRHQLIPPFFAELNGEKNDKISVKRLVHYFTPRTAEGYFMITALAEKFGGIDEEQARAIRLEVERAATQSSFDERTIQKTQDLMKKAGDEFKELM